MCIGVCLCLSVFSHYKDNADFFSPGCGTQFPWPPLVGVLPGAVRVLGLRHRQPTDCLQHTVCVLCSVISYIDNTVLCTMASGTNQSQVEIKYSYFQPCLPKDGFTAVFSCSR